MFLQALLFLESLQVYCTSCSTSLFGGGGRGAGVNDAGFEDWRQNVFHITVYQVLSTVV